MQASTYDPQPPPKHLPDDSPNILIILIDDAGPALPEPLGGAVHTPTLGRLLSEGIGYNRFHTTAMCSPTRASLLTGRNHHHVGYGQIAELANDWDGYTGVIPKSSALQAEVLKQYGYSTSAFGKWHNTPANETTKAGPFDNWPSEIGFEYFYGFLSGEASQYEPNLVRNTTQVLPPKTPEEGYHLSEDLADDAIAWLRTHRAIHPDKPFYMYWASGAIHGPHHVHKEWADKYKGKFDDGWDAYRERAFESAKQKGWIPKDAQLTARHPQLDGWEDIPEEHRAFQSRLMEVAAGYAEHVDTQAGRIVDELDRLGISDNTLVFYIWGDNGSSGEGQNGTISELISQNGIPTTIDQHIAALEGLGGLDVLGTPLTDNQYHAGWAWAGSTPYQGLKLLASHFGGTRNPMAVRWPRQIQHDSKPRTQFHHCNDLVPTIYDLIGITPPESVHGVHQDPIDGISFAYSFDDPDAEGRLKTQYFEIMGSRSIYHDGWVASAFGPKVPWTRPDPAIFQWTPDDDTWELYNIDEDWSQANDLAAEMPEKLRDLKDLFLIEATKNKALPIGGGLWVPVFHPEMKPAPRATEWEFPGDFTRLPEFTAPALGNRPNELVITADIPEGAEGVLYKLGANSGGLTLFAEGGHLVYEYNLFIIQRTQIRTAEAIPAGAVEIKVTTTYEGDPRPAGPLNIVIEANGGVVAKGTVPVSAPLTFTANDCLDIGQALGSPVSLDYFDKAPFPFTGTIDRVRVRYL
jgi:arylsulfatase